MLKLTNKLTIQDIDETILFVRKQMQSRYGNRLKPSELEKLQDTIDNLLDARILLQQKKSTVTLPEEH